MIPSELDEITEEFRDSLQVASIQYNDANRCYEGQMCVAKDTKSLKRPQLVACSERTLEIMGYGTAKKTNMTRGMIDLVNVYSLTLKEHPKLSACIVLVTPDQTVYMRGTDRDATLLWYSIVFNSVHVCRSLSHEKSMPRDHFPEYTWDVKVLGSSKYSIAHYSNSNNITDKEPELAGRKRVCLYRNCIAFVHMNEEPLDVFSLVDYDVQYLKRPQCYLIARTNITYYGNRNKHFIFCIREMLGEKAKEVVLEAESEREAEEMKLALETIIRRESKLIGLVNANKTFYESLNSPETCLNHNGRASTSQSSSLPRDQLDVEMRKNKKSIHKKAEFRFKGLLGSLRKKFSKSKENNSLSVDSDINSVAEGVAMNKTPTGENGTEESGGTLREEEHQATRQKDKMRYQKGGESHEMTSFCDLMNSSISSNTSFMVRPSTSSSSLLDSCLSNVSYELSTLSSNAHTTDDRGHRRKYNPIPSFDIARRGYDHAENLQVSMTGSFDSCYSSITNKKRDGQKKIIDFTEGPRMPSNLPKFGKRRRDEFDVFRYLTGTLSRSMNNISDLLPESRPSRLYRTLSLRCLTIDELKKMENDMNNWLATAPKPKKKTKRRKRIQSHDDTYSKTSPVPSSRHLSMSSQSTQRSNASRKGPQSARCDVSRSHSRQLMDNSLEDSIHSSESDMQPRANSMESQRSFIIGAFKGSNKHLIPKAIDETEPRKYDLDFQHVIRAEPLFYEVRDDIQRLSNKRERRHGKLEFTGVRGSTSFHSGCQVINEETHYTMAPSKQSKPITGIIG